jgi:sarcosine oxidase / L-pipecolate oxidase
MRLDPKMAKRYRHTPVLLDFSLGFYMFPVRYTNIPNLVVTYLVQPTNDNLVKIALHTNGHTASPLDISVSSGVDAGKGAVPMPRTTRTHGNLGTRVPADVLKTLHTHLCEAYPELGALPLETTRLCWYLDTPDEDWIIDEVAGYGSLFIATGGSGHAFKVPHNSITDIACG